MRRCMKLLLVSLMISLLTVGICAAKEVSHVTKIEVTYQLRLVGGSGTTANVLFDGLVPGSKKISFDSIITFQKYDIKELQEYIKDGTSTTYISKSVNHIVQALGLKSYVGNELDVLDKGKTWNKELLTRYLCKNNIKGCYYVNLDIAGENGSIDHIFTYSYISNKADIQSAGYKTLIRANLFEKDALNSITYTPLSAMYPQNINIDVLYKDASGTILKEYKNMTINQFANEYFALLQKPTMNAMYNIQTGYNQYLIKNFGTTNFDKNLLINKITLDEVDLVNSQKVLIKSVSLPQLYMAANLDLLPDKKYQMTVTLARNGETIAEKVDEKELEREIPADAPEEEKETPPVIPPKQTEPKDENSTIDLNKFKLSTSKQETKGSIQADTNQLTVTNIKDFEVGQGIAIEGIEEVSTSENGSRNFTWFVAKILEINGNVLTINRKPFASGADKRIIHDNYYIFREICNENNGENVLIKVPKGEYNVYAINVISPETAAPRLLVRDVSSNLKANGIPADLFYYKGKKSVDIDFNNSTINFNGEFYRGFDYSYHYGTVYDPNIYSRLSFTNQLSMFRIVDSSNVTIKNIQIKFNATTATRSEQVAEAQSYGFAFDGVQNGHILNAIVKNSITDGILIRKGNELSRNITIENSKMIANSRQGMSVTSVDGLLVNNCEFSETGRMGTYKAHPPMSGIDLELEYDSTISNVTIKNSLFKDNITADIQVFCAYKNEKEQKNYVVDNCVFYKGSSSEVGVGQILLYGNNKMLKDFTLRNSTFIQSNLDGAVRYSFVSYFIEGNPNFTPLFENNNFMGGIFITNTTKSAFKNNNFIMDGKSYITKNTRMDRNSQFENCFFYTSENAINQNSSPFYNTGMDFKDSYIYNAHPKTKLWIPVRKEDTEMQTAGYSSFENVSISGPVLYGTINYTDFPKLYAKPLYKFTALYDTGISEVKVTSYTELVDKDKAYMEERYEKTKKDIDNALRKYGLTY